MYTLFLALFRVQAGQPPDQVLSRRVIKIGDLDKGAAEQGDVEKHKTHDGNCSPLEMEYPPDARRRSPRGDCTRRVERRVGETLAATLVAPFSPAVKKRPGDHDNAVYDRRELDEERRACNSEKRAPKGRLAHVGVDNAGFSKLIRNAGYHQDDCKEAG